MVASVAPAVPTPVTSRPVTAAEMQRLQPVLGELIQLMEGGRSERLQNWVNNRTQKPGAAASVADAYARALGTARVTGIGKVSFQGQAVADVQVVDGVVELRIWDEAGTFRVVYVAKLADAVTAKLRGMI